MHQDQNMLYFQRRWDEERVEDGVNWGHSTWLFETDFEGFPIRQLEVYECGRKLRYSIDNLEDSYGQLGDQPLDIVDFQAFKMSAREFEKAWLK